MNKERKFVVVASSLFIVVLVVTGYGPLSGGHSAGHSDVTSSDSQIPAGSSTWYLTPSGAPAREPTAGQTVLDWSLQDWFAGTPPPTVLSIAIDGYVHVDEVVATLTYQFPQALLGGGTRPELTTWLQFERGDERYTTAHGFFDADDQQLGDEVVATFDLELPYLGFQAQPGDTLHLMAAHYYVDGTGDAAPQLELATSFVTLETRSSNFGVGRIASTESHTLELAGGRCVQDTGALPLAALGLAPDWTHNVAVEPGMGLEVRAETAGGAFTDIDIMVFAPDGTRIAHGAGPGNVETVRLESSNLALFETVEVYVFNCHQNRNLVDVEIRTLAYEESSIDHPAGSDHDTHRSHSLHSPASRP